MKTNILIVDDEQSARDFCAEILKEMGLKTELAESGARALDILEGGIENSGRQAPNLIKLQIMVSGIRFSGAPRLPMGRGAENTAVAVRPLANVCHYHLQSS